MSYEPGIGDDAKKMIKILAVGRKKGNKQPVATMVPLKNVDMESLAFSYHPDFMEIIEKARAEVEPGKRFWKGSFFDLKFENLVLWARSELIGSACNSFKE